MYFIYIYCMEITEPLFERLGGRIALLRLLHHFYADVRQHQLLGPVFERQIENWPSTLKRLLIFGSSPSREPTGRRIPLVSATQLGTLLQDHRTVCVLNACKGGRSGADDPFAGTAQSLARQGIPAVIAMQRSVSDAAAIVLAQELYGALAVGYPVDAALTEARKMRPPAGTRGSGRSRRCTRGQTTGGCSTFQRDCCRIGRRCGPRRERRRARFRAGVLRRGSGAVLLRGENEVGEALAMLGGAGADDRRWLQNRRAERRRQIVVARAGLVPAVRTRESRAGRRASGLRSGPGPESNRQPRPGASAKRCRSSKARSPATR